MHTAPLLLILMAALAVLVVLPRGLMAQPASLPREPVAQECAMSTPRARAMRLLPALQRGYGVQYWGEAYTAEALAAQPHGLVILEITKVGAPYSDTGREVFFTPEEIVAINHGSKRPVLGYLNVTEIETYRDYWIDHGAANNGNGADPPPDWQGPHTSHGEHLAAYWTQSWKDIVLARVDRLMATGVDGIFLDDVLHYYSFALDDTLRWPEGERPEGPAGAPEFALEMMRLVELIAAQARSRNCDALIFVNNGAFIGRDAGGIAATRPDGQIPFASYLDAIDAIMLENVFASTTHPHTLEALKEDFQSNGVPVLALEVATQLPGVEPDELRKSIAQKARSDGIYLYVAADSAFNQIYSPVILPPQAPVLAQ